MLKDGAVVLADRYAFTAFARDVTRGVDPLWVRNLYSFAPQPDVVLYFRVPLDVAVERITSSRAKIKYYEAGMDLGLSDNRVTSFRLFQQRIIDEYDKMVDEFNFTAIDGTLPIQKEQKMMRQIIRKALQGWDSLLDPEKEPQTPMQPNQPVNNAAVQPESVLGGAQ